MPLTLAKLADQMVIVCGGLRHFLSPWEDKYHCTLYSHCYYLAYLTAVLETMSEGRNGGVFIRTRRDGKLFNLARLHA